jgi:hypothetical protein
MKSTHIALSLLLGLILLGCSAEKKQMTTASKETDNNVYLFGDFLRKGSYTISEGHNSLQYLIQPSANCKPALVPGMDYIIDIRHKKSDGTLTEPQTTTFLQLMASKEPLVLLPGDVVIFKKITPKS